MAGMKISSRRRARVLKRYGTAPRRYKSRAVSRGSRFGLTNWQRPEAGLPDRTVR